MIFSVHHEFVIARLTSTFHGCYPASVTSPPLYVVSTHIILNLWLVFNKMCLINKSQSQSTIWCFKSYKSYIFWRLMTPTRALTTHPLICMLLVEERRSKNKLWPPKNVRSSYVGCAYRTNIREASVAPSICQSLKKGRHVQCTLLEDSIVSEALKQKNMTVGFGLGKEVGGQTQGPCFKTVWNKISS